MLFESQFRNLIRLLLIEGKIDVLQARYPDIDIYFLSLLDPTPQKKYLQWLAMQSDRGNLDVDADDVKDTILQFHNAQQRLPSNKRDINQYKTFKDVKAAISQIGDVSKTQRKQAVKSEGARHIGTVDGYDVYFITSHEAAMLLGKGTRWCITQSDGEHWDNYVKNVKFFYAIRQIPDHNSYDKIAFACYLSGGAIEVFDAQDNSIGTRTNLELREFIEVAKNKYINYTVTSKNQTITIVNNKIEGPIKKDDRIEWYKDGVLHREDGPAIEYKSGIKYWYIYGEEYSQKEFEKLMNK